MIDSSQSQASTGRPHLQQFKGGRRKHVQRPFSHITHSSVYHGSSKLLAICVTALNMYSQAHLYIRLWAMPYDLGDISDHKGEKTKQNKRI